jgi:CRP/FNR family transcriptional regulator
LATIGPGDFFGEVALLEPVRRTATVSARSPLRFFVVADTSFRGLLKTDPEIERKLLRTLVHRVVSPSGDPA